MLYYDRIGFFEGIDVNKTSESKEYDLFHCWYFLDKEFKFQPDVYNGCLDVLMISMNPSNIAILKTDCIDYCCVISRTSKSEAINLM